MSLRAVASIITIILLGIILFFAREEIIHAWELLSTVNLWILALIIPVQIAVYFAAGEMMFSYLRDKKLISHISLPAQARMALEMNFVNHALPSAGVSGITYMTWRLHKYRISAGRAALAQLMRFAAAMLAFLALLILSLIIITIDGSINRWMILLSSLLVGTMIGGIALGIYLVSSPSRSRKFSHWIVITWRRIKRTLHIPTHVMKMSETKILSFFEEMHDDYVEIRRDKKLLIKPFLWGILFTIGDVALYWITFMALGTAINPAPLLIAYGLGTMATVVLVTPGGAGGMEAIMVATLAVAGVAGGTAIAGILLTRVILMICTIGFGYRLL